MTWHISLARIRPAIAAAVTVLSAGSILATTGLLALPAPSPEVPRCVQLISRALASVDTPVKGSYDCLAFNQKLGLAEGGYSEDDAGLRQWVSEQGRNRIWLVGRDGDGPWEYDVTGPGMTNVRLFIWLDGAGLVNRIDFEVLG